jgi:hypothetical protein
VPGAGTAHGFGGRFARRCARALALAAACVLVVCGLHRPTAAQGDWQLIVAEGAGLCARATPYAFWSRVRDPDRLLVYFQGGGMCWDAATCAPGAGYFDDVIEGGEIGAYTHGIFDDGRAENPLAAYSAVFIPYCTGDWHAGTRTVDYGEPAGVVHHDGYANAAAAVAYARSAFPRPAHTVIAGCSAGAYGAIVHAPALLAQYRRAAVFGDAASGIVPPGWGGLETWGAFDRAGRAAPDAFADRLWASAMRGAARARFAQYLPAYDERQQFYLAAMGGGDWAGGRARSIAALERAQNFTAFTAETGEHCILETDRFYSEITPEGARFRDAWAAWAGAG